MFEVEGGVGKLRTFRRERLADVQADARVALAAVPVAPVALHLAEFRRNLIGGGFDFLEADDVRAIAFDPLDDLGVTRADAVDVPGGDLHGRLKELGAMSDCDWNLWDSNQQSEICKV